MTFPIDRYHRRFAICRPDESLAFPMQSFVPCACEVTRSSKHDIGHAFGRYFVQVSYPRDRII